MVVAACVREREREREISSQRALQLPVGEREIYGRPRLRVALTYSLCCVSHSVSMIVCVRLSGSFIDETNRSFAPALQQALLSRLGAVGLLRLFCHSPPSLEPGSTCDVICAQHRLLRDPLQRYWTTSALTRT